MSSTNALNRRIRRRETHSPRSVPAIVVAVLLILALIWMVIEIVLDMANRPALLVAPHTMATSLVEVTSVAPAILIGAGLALALVGMLLVILALSPGRRARHVIGSAHSVTIVDDQVIASALARRAASAALINPDQARVTVSRRHADIHLTPTSGFPIDRASVMEVVSGEINSYGLEPPLATPRLSVATQGEVGA